MVTISIADRAVPAGKYWQWRGQSIYSVSAGPSQPGRPPLLLIHGFGASTDHWRKNIAELQADFSVWAIDLLGFGRSAKPDWVYSGALWQAQLHDFITEVIGEPVVVAGNSLGGYAALCVAAEHPEATAGVILLNSAGPFAGNSETTLPTESNSWQASLRDAVRAILLQPWASFLLFQYVRQRWVIRRTLEKVYLDRSAITDRLIEEIYRPSCDRGAAKVFASVFKSPRGATLDELLGKLQHPLLLLWGEGDPWMDAQTRSRQFRQFYPQAREVFLTAGHCPHDEIPEQVNREIRNWVLAECIARGAIDS